MIGRFLSWIVMVLAIFFASVGQSYAQETAPSCREVRFSNSGWTDLTATTATAATILRALGYDPQVRLLSVPIGYEALAAGDTDVFLGYWNPSMTPGISPYLDKGSIELVRYNLRGAKFTLAVPRYLHEAGLQDFADIARFGSGLNHEIHAIEPGAAANITMAEMIAANAFDLKDFRLVESSEAAMLAEVAVRVQEKRPIVFLAWEPHPMNLRFDMAYLTGGDDYFGPDFGGARVATVTRRNYVRDCPNVGKLLQNLEFTLRLENEIMYKILDEGEAADAAARDWLIAHQEVLPPFLDGVTTVDGADGLAAVRASLGLEMGASETEPVPVVAQTTAEPPPAAQHREAEISIMTQVKAAIADPGAFVTGHKIPVGQVTRNGFDWFKATFASLFNGLRLVFDASLRAAQYVLLFPHPLIFIAALGGLSYFLKRDWKNVFLTVLGFLFVLNQGYWKDAMETLSLLLWSFIVCIGLGVPIGIYCAHRPRLYRLIEPVLDMMQVVPSYVYLLPGMALFRIGMVPGLLATVVFVIPVAIRLAEQGIAATPKALWEAGKAFGASKRQLLWKVELPYAMPQIRAAMTQTIMLSLSMVVIAAAVGANGLGIKVYRALQGNNVELGFEAGLVIVVVAVVLDRLFRPKDGGITS